jgi:hypothetical protein
MAGQPDRKIHSSSKAIFVLCRKALFRIQSIWSAFFGAGGHLQYEGYHGIRLDASFKGLWPAVCVDFPRERR